MGSKHLSTFLSDHVINVYTKCGDHVNLSGVDKMSPRNLYSWNNMIYGYTKLGMVKPVMMWFYNKPERDVVSWNRVAMTYVHRGWFHEASRFYNMLRRLDIRFNKYSLARIVMIFVKLRKLRLAAHSRSNIV